MKPIIPLRAALSDADLFGNLIGGPSWAAWRGILLAAMGEALDESELRHFQSLTHRDAEPRR